MSRRFFWLRLDGDVVDHAGLAILCASDIDFLPGEVLHPFLVFQTVDYLAGPQNPLTSSFYARLGARGGVGA